MHTQKTGPGRIVLFVDETRGHNHQSLGVARWVERLCGAKIYEIRVPSFSGLQRLRLLKQQARHLGTASDAEIKEWLKKKLKNADPQTAKDLLKSEMKKVRKFSTYFP